MTSIHSMDDLARRRGGEALLRRLEWLENRVHWTGELRRRDICNRFQISPQQASLDISAYLSLCPKNLIFSNENKAYSIAPAYAPIFQKSPVRWLENESPADNSLICFERLSSPWQPAPDELVRALVSSHQRKMPLSIQYLSLARDKPIRRVICPHSIVEADGRLHSRAFDYERRRFADFLMARMSEPKVEPNFAWVDGAADRAWHERVDIKVSPNPKLSQPQAASAMREVNLPPKGGSIEIRKALAFYLVRAMRFVNLDIPDRGRRYVCSNAGEIEKIIDGFEPKP